MKPGSGTILEAAFVDPAYSYPPAEGQGRHAIELQATKQLLNKVDPNDDDKSLNSNSQSVLSFASDDLSVSKAQDKAEAELRKRQVQYYKSTEEEVVTYRGFSFFKCCQSSETFVEDGQFKRDPTPEEIAAVRAKAEERANNLKQQQISRRELRKQRKMENAERRARRAQRKKDALDREKYNRVAEGILIYRLNTATRTITLLSGPSSNTDVENLMTEMIVAHASPSNDRTRRGICVLGRDGSRATIIACEQRTAIAWLEAIDLMLSNKNARVSELLFVILWSFTSGFFLIEPFLFFLLSNRCWIDLLVLGL